MYLFLGLMLIFVGSVQLTTARLDIVLLMDSSDGVRSNFFEQEKAFAVDVIKQLFHAENRIGLYTFGKRTHRQFNMNVYTDLEQMITAINYMWYSTGIGDVTSAIEAVLREGFSATSGNRECVPNTLLILTHSGIENTSRAFELNIELQERLIQTFVISMGKATDLVTANFITITESADRLFNLTALTDLQQYATTVAKTLQSDLGRSGCGKMTEWGAWTACSKTCNTGLQFRSRQCLKEQENDLDCEGTLTEDTVCRESVCTVDGGWSFWSQWGGCSKTCEGGTQTRHRDCTRPTPAEGGKECEGINSESRSCAAWPCPDCERSCSPGGILSQDCEFCECSSVALYGKIMDDMNRTVEGANIFLASGRYMPIATTDSLGRFLAGGICIMNEQIYVEAQEHASQLVDPAQVNSTHWTVNMVMETYIPPVFRVNPEDKTRMVEQSFSLCCTALGKPSPTEYKWFKDGEILADVRTNTLTVTSATVSDAGVYKCSVDTEAGVTQSDEAVVTVKETVGDTCGPPLPKIKQLPFGCFPTNGEPGNSTIDTGACDRSTVCMTSTLLDNGTCTDWWHPHCCDVKESETIDITCDGFSYQITKVISCECKPCIYRTSISGRATGKENGTEIPLQLGSIYFENKRVAQTNMAGFFSFEVPNEYKKVVLLFTDEYFEKFLATTKIIHPIEGEDNHVTIILPIRPKPVLFNSSDGVEFLLGGQDGEQPLIGSLSVPSDALTTKDGELVRGTVKASMNFIDPRNRDNIDTAGGEFQSQLPDGTPLPLETYGLVQLSFKDENNNPLSVNKDIRVSFDASLFDFTAEENDETDLALWNFDTNKGQWIEAARMKFETGSSKRSLLSSTISANIRLDNIPDLEHYETIRVQEIVGYNGNIDRPIYGTVDKRSDNPKEGACFVSVSVYEDLSLREPYNKGDLEAVIYTKLINNSTYVGVKRSAFQNGHACLETFCDHLVYISVNSVDGNLYAGNHFLPLGYPVRRTINNSEVEVESRDFGKALQKCPSPPYPMNTVCDGPFYQHEEAALCRNHNARSNAFQFKFAPFTRPPQMEYATGSAENYDQLLSWYPVSPERATFRSCFMKVLIKISEAFDMRVVARSLLDGVSGELFGTSDVGPTQDPETNDRTTRAACFEFRCPGYVRNSTHEFFDLRTALDVHLTTSSNARCSMRTASSYLTGVTPITHPTRGDVGFQFLVEPGRNYGPIYGIFISDKPESEVKKFCYSGSDAGVNLNSIMRPKRNPAIEFDCLSSQ